MRATLLGLLCLLSATAGAVAPSFPGAVTTSATSVDVDVPVVDNTPVVSLIDLPTAPGTVIDVDVTLNLAHTSSGQLRISLLSPGGTTVTLSSNNGGSNDDVFAGTTFDDQASGTPSAPNVRNFTYVDKVATGPIQPEQPLGAVVGEPAAGPWALVVLDDTNGSTGVLHGWSITVTSLPTAPSPSPAAGFDGTGGPIPDNDATGLVRTVDVSGIGRRLYRMTALVNVAHNSSGQLSFFLTAPSGKRIDLVTNVGGGNRDLYAGTTFDDAAGTPIGDRTLPSSGTALATTPGEGALSAFMGDDPNGTWTLTVRDGTAGTTGTLRGWTLAFVTAGACGDGTVDAGEACDDGNATNGDGCDANCTPTGCGNGIVTAGEACDDGNTVDGDACPASCNFAETACGNCADDDANGQVDAFDAACGAGPLTVEQARVTHKRAGRDKLAVTLRVDPSDLAAGPLVLQLRDAAGGGLCAPLGEIRQHGAGRFAASGGTIAGGPASVRVTSRHGATRLLVRGRNMDLGALAEPVAVGLQVGGHLLAGDAGH